MVTVDVGGVSGDLTVSPSRLFFMPADYGPANAKTVTVYAGEDLDADDDTATLTHTVRGGDYTGVAADTVAVTVDDNDTRGVTVAPTSLNIAAGSRGTFTIRLNTQPKGSVRITVTENPAVDRFSVSPTSVTFSSSNWNRSQTVTVRADANFDTANPPVNCLVNAINTSSTSRDQNYDTEDPDAAVADVRDGFRVGARRPTEHKLVDRRRGQDGDIHREAGDESWRDQQ